MPAAEQSFLPGVCAVAKVPGFDEVQTGDLPYTNRTRRIGIPNMSASESGNL